MIFFCFITIANHDCGVYAGAFYGLEMSGPAEKGRRSAHTPPPKRPRPSPENCTTGCFALPLLHQHQRFALLGQEGPHQICRDSATTTTGGRPAHRGRGRRSYGFGILFHHLLRATYIDHGKVQIARFPATTVPPKVPVKMWLPRPPLRPLRFWEEEWTLFFCTFVSLVRLILLVAQAEGVGGEGAATEPAFGYQGGTADRKQV